MVGFFSLDHIYWIIAAFLILIFYRIGRQVFLTYQCVDDKTLRDFMYGKLKMDNEKNRRVISHLGHCEKCRDRFREIQKGRPLEDHLVE